MLTVYLDNPSHMYFLIFFINTVLHSRFPHSTIFFFFSTATSAPHPFAANASACQWTAILIMYLPVLWPRGARVNAALPDPNPYALLPCPSTLVLVDH